MADGAVAISKGVGDDLVAKAGVDPRTLAVIYNPVDVEAVGREAEHDPGHPWLNDAVPVVLGVGRLTYQKDFATLLKAFAHLRQTRPARLIILGEGEDRASLTQLAARLGISEDVDFPGYKTNRLGYIARAKVFALSSRWEGFGNVLVEALACGVPVVSTDCPSGPREILDAGAFGALVPVGDDRAMATALADALDHPPPAERQRARAAVFAPEAIAAQYAKALGIHKLAAREGDGR
jgi:glycosyltransferase involved in cell wall biosynthesis